MSCEHKWIIIADGEGAQACLLIGENIKNQVHKFMCFCKKDWEHCETDDIQNDIRSMDDDDNWIYDESGSKFSISWSHETGKLTIYKVSNLVLF